MPALPIGIYHQGSKLLDALKSYYVNEAGMSSSFNHHPNRHPFCPTPSTRQRHVWQIASRSYPVGNHVTHVTCAAKLSRVQTPIAAPIHPYLSPPLAIK